MDAPRVSIVTSTYNRSAVLKRAIRSVLAQRDFSAWEMCIVGDCTPDDSEAVVAAYGDPRLRFYNLPVKSPPVAHGAIAKNHGVFQMARAPYIAYLDDDDEYHPDFLRIMMGAVAKHPERHRKSEIYYKLHRWPGTINPQQISPFNRQSKKSLTDRRLGRLIHRLPTDLYPYPVGM